MKVKIAFCILTFLSVSSLSYSQDRSDESSSTGDNQSENVSEDPEDVVTIPPETGLEDLFVDQVFEPDRILNKSERHKI